MTIPIPNLSSGQKYRKPAALDDSAQIFETNFENKRDTPVQLLEYGRQFISVAAGETRTVESRSPLTTYSRWSRIVFSGKDKISFHENKDWHFPFPDKLCLEVLYGSGTAISESVRVGGKFYTAPLGILIFVPVDFDDVAFAFVAKLEKKLVEKKFKEGDYFTTRMVAEWVRTPRNKKENAVIEGKLFAKKAEKQKADMDKYEKEIRSNYADSPKSM